MFSRPRMRAAVGIVGLGAAVAMQGIGAQGVSASSQHDRSAQEATLFTAPTSVAFDTFQNAYVTDAADGHVVKVSGTGKSLAVWGKPGAGQGLFGTPAGVAVDAKYVYVVDTKHSRLQALSYAGKLQATFGKKGKLRFSHPTGVAIDPSGGVYVADTGNNRIVQLSPRGVVEARWDAVHNTRPIVKPTPVLAPTPTKGKKKTKPAPTPTKTKPRKVLHIGHFSRPQGVVVDIHLHVWVADTGHNRIVKLSRYGEPLAVWGKAGSGKGEFNRPTGISVDAFGNVWVADTGNNRVQELSPKGAPLAVIGGTKGSADDQLNSPRGVSVQARNTIYIADTGNHRIVRYSAKGQNLGIWK